MIISKLLSQLLRLNSFILVNISRGDTITNINKVSPAVHGNKPVQHRYEANIKDVDSQRFPFGILFKKLTLMKKLILIENNFIFL